MNYYFEIKNKLIDNEIYSKVKDYSKERNRLLTYYEVGKLLSEAGKEYGKDIIGEYSNKLIFEVNKKYNKRTLFRMKQFYEIIGKQKVSPIATQLTWSHWIELLPIKDINKRDYYINQCIKLKLSRNDLRQIIKSREYERLPEDAKIFNNKPETIKDLIKNPILIKNSNNKEILSEKALQLLILEDIPSFLKELGNGFTFIENEYKIKIGYIYNYIDLLLYNIKYKCYVVVELKIAELKKEHIGQIITYMNFIDKNIKTFDEDKTIGIIICKHDNKYIMEYCSDDRILSKEYKIV